MKEIELDNLNEDKKIIVDENKTKLLMKLKFLFGKFDSLLYNEENLKEEYNLDLINLNISDEVLDTFDMESVQKLFKVNKLILFYFFS